MDNVFHIEEHPDWYHDVAVMKTLILGSFPPHQDKRQVAFYYPNKQNYFWRILAKVAGFDLKREQDTVEERKRIMEILQVGVQNVGKTILRKNKSAKDTDIEIKAFQDILSIIDAHPELEQILLPGFSAPSSTFQSFVKYLEEKNIRPEIPRKVSAGTVFEVKIGQRKIRCVVLTSTSPLASLPFEKRVEQFKPWLMPVTDKKHD